MVNLQQLFENFAVSGRTFPLHRLALAGMLCSGLLTGFQASPNSPATQKPSVSQPVQPTKDTTPRSQQNASTPTNGNPDDQAPAEPPIDQPAPLAKPQPLPVLPPAHTDLTTSLDALVTKQTVKMGPYIPIIQEITIGIEQISLVKNMWYGLKKLKKKDADQPHEWAGKIGILWKGNIQLVGSLGYASLYPPVLKPNKHAYRTQGLYGGLGIGYVSHYNATNDVYAGFHYNRAHFTNHTIAQNANTQVTSKDLTASWFEVVIGAETRFFEKIALYGGCTLHMEWLYHFTPFDPAKNYAIPGYGLNANKFNLGLNLYILYKFSFIERIIKLT